MSGCISVGLFFLGIISLFINPTFGIVCLLLAFSVAASGSSEGETTYVYPKWTREVNFGPNGPPWANEENPIQISGQLVFVSSIARIYEEGPKPPDLKMRKGISLSVAGTGRPATIWVTLHTGKNFQVTGVDTDRVRSWFDRLGVQKSAF